MGRKMKRGILILGSIFTISVLILASFPSVASSQAVESRDMLQRVRDRHLDREWNPGELIFGIFWIFIVILVMFLGPIPHP